MLVSGSIPVTGVVLKVKVGNRVDYILGGNEDVLSLRLNVLVSGSCKLVISRKKLFVDISSSTVQEVAMTHNVLLEDVSVRVAVNVIIEQLFFGARDQRSVLSEVNLELLIYSFVNYHDFFVIDIRVDASVNNCISVNFIDDFYDVKD